MKVSGQINTSDWEPIDELKQLPTYVPATTGHKSEKTIAYPITQSESDLLQMGHLQSLETIKEISNPVQRAAGTVIRLVPFTAIWFLLAVILIWSGELDFLVAFFGFCLLTAITYYLLDQTEYKHSAAGTEIHKANLAHDLAARRIDNDHELRKTALESYLKHLQGQ